MIDCDQVFRVLTRGPFPSGHAGDALVEAHLADCASCRQLAEALRPSDDVLREALSEEECLQLPRYDHAVDRPDPWGGRTPQATRAAVHRAAPRRRVLASTKWTSPQMTRGAIFVFFTVFATFLLIESFVQRWASVPVAHDAPGAQDASALVASDASPRVPVTPAIEMALEQLAQSNATLSPRASQSSRIEFDRRCVLPTLRDESILARVPLAAIHNSPKPGVVLVDSLAAQCCTQCHSAAASHRSSMAALSASATRCHECHSEMVPSRGS